MSSFYDRFDIKHMTVADALKLNEAAKRTCEEDS